MISESVRQNKISFSNKLADDDVIFDYQIERITCKDDILSNINEIKEFEKIVNDEIEKIDAEIDRLTNKSDIFDYTLACTSGIICGLIDSFFVGKLDIEKFTKESHEQVNRFIEKYARHNGYEGDDGLKGAISFLEKKFPVNQDNIWKGKGYTSTRLHHLDDIAHHPTIGGLFFYILVEIIGIAFFVDKNGEWHSEKVDIDKKDLFWFISSAIISGVLGWFVYQAKNKKFGEEGKKLPKPLYKLILTLSQSPIIIDILYHAHKWFGHLVSDMGGSKNTPDGGMGIPGIFLSLLKEISSIPPINKTKLPKLISDWYSKDKFNLRSEVSISKSGLDTSKQILTKQTIPILLNELIVRLFYFVKHLIEEKKDKEWSEVDWKKVIPFNNRTIARMISVSSGTLSAVDILDSAIRSTIENGANLDNPKLYIDFVLQINIVGIGRFSFALGNDIKMGIDRDDAIQERMYLRNKLALFNMAEIHYCQANVWQTAEETQQAMEQLYATAKNCIKKDAELYSKMFNNWSKIVDNIPLSPKDKVELINILEY